MPTDLFFATAHLPGLAGAVVQATVAGRLPLPCRVVTTAIAGLLDDGRQP